MSYTIENVNKCTKKIIFNFETLDLSTEIKTAVVTKQKSEIVRASCRERVSVLV